MEELKRLGRMPVGLTIPAFAILLVVFGIPIFLLFLTSLNAPDFSLVNYQAFLRQPANVRVRFQTIEVSMVATAICIIIGYPTAYLITAVSKRLRTVLLIFVAVPDLTSLLVRTYTRIVILGDRGLINNLLLDLHLISSPLQLMYSRMAVYVGIVHIMLPVMILPLVSVMMGIDKSLMAAARSMGATPPCGFWRVFFLRSLPVVRSGSLLFVLCLGFYITPAVLGGLRDAMLSNFIAAQIASSFNTAYTAISAFILLGIAAVVLSIVGLDLSATRVSSARAVVRLGAADFHHSALLDELACPCRAKRWRAKLYQARGESPWWTIVGAVFVGLVMFYLLFPAVVVVIVSFTDGTFLEFPPAHLSLK